MGFIDYLLILVLNFGVPPEQDVQPKGAGNANETVLVTASPRRISNGF